MEFNKNDFSAFRENAKQALREVESEFGIEIKMGNISYSEEAFTCKLEVVRTDIDADFVNWKKNCMYYGLAEEDYNSVISIHNGKYKLKRFNNKKRKYPIVAESINDNNKLVGLTVEAVTDHVVRRNGNLWIKNWISSKSINMYDMSMLFFMFKFEHEIVV